MSGLTDAGSTHRAQLFRQLQRRHRMVRLLRVAVPLVGVLVLAALVLQIYLGALTGGVAISGARIDRSRLIVDRPTINGTLSGVGRYELVAQTASAPITDARFVDLDSIDATMSFDSGARAVGHADSGVLDFPRRQIRTSHAISLTSSDGISARIEGGAIDMVEQTLSTVAGARFEFPGGSSLTARTMTYNATRGTWRFEKVVISIVPPPLAVSPGTGQ
jgi:lipopolysaccharide export system protein LptC